MRVGLGRGVCVALGCGIRVGVLVAVGGDGLVADGIGVALGGDWVAVKVGLGCWVFPGFGEYFGG